MVVRTTIEVKKALIAKHESGTRVADLAVMFEMPKSTICTILKNKEAIKAAQVAKGVTILSSRRSKSMEIMEKLVFIWIQERQLSGESLSETMICQKAKDVYRDLVKDLDHPDDFKASRGWFENFKKRIGISTFVKHKEYGGSTNSILAENFAKEFRDSIDRDGYVANQVFDCDKTGLFWKRMPERRSLTQDHLTFLLCSNASGDCKINPLILSRDFDSVGCTDNYSIRRSDVGITLPLFMEWLETEFAPTVKTYLRENQLPLKALLVMDKNLLVPSLSSSSSSSSSQFFDFIRIRFFPSNTTSLIQPMNRGVKEHFKTLYTKEMLQTYVETGMKERYTVLHCLRLVQKVWKELSWNRINHSWRNLWPDCVIEMDIKESFLLPDIIALGRSLGLQVDERAVRELVTDCKTDLTTEELQRIKEEEEDDDVENCSLKRETIPPKIEISKLLSHWSQAQSIIERWHPDKVLVNGCLNLFNDTIMEYFRKMDK